MTYQVLALKWRPQRFADVIGQQHVLTALSNSLKLGRIHHAYLFSGTRGVGKTSIARLLAKGLNCEIGITDKPCEVCNNCCEIKHGCFVDLIEVDAASRTKVEDTRDLLDNIQYSPSRGRFKVYLIDEVHMLSRYSFNALLKTLEEPPAHIKFILATTDPQKLPLTIISRCLQFHLKELSIEQIYIQLEYILNAENIIYESRALQLLARAARGSLRDALSLTDQAIASGDGKLKTKNVSNMLGTLDEEYAILLIEAIIEAKGEHALALINTAAASSIDWETLLVDMMRLLHRLAILQLSGLATSTDVLAIEQRLSKLARNISPSEIQFYYQTLLIGRKELPFAPSGRTGVEMTLLRALAFHAHKPISKLCKLHQSSSLNELTPTPTPLKPNLKLSDTTNSVLEVRRQLRYTHREIKSENDKLMSLNKVNLTIEDAISKCSSLRSDLNEHQLSYKSEKFQVDEDLYCQKLINSNIEEINAESITPKLLKRTMKYKKTPELMAKITKESTKRDNWAAEINQLRLPKLVEQMALNTWKEQKGNQIRLHLRSNQKHLNSTGLKKILTEALVKLYDTVIELTIIDDDDFTVLTPQELCQFIYKEKINKAREVIIADNNIKTLCQFFNADLDEESVCPL